MNHRPLAPVAAILLLGLLPGSALGATLDQHNTASPTTGCQGAHTFAQSVTTGVAGTLAQVDLMALDTEAGGGTVTVKIEGIKRATGWPPDNSVLAQGSAHVSTMGWYSFTLSPAISLLAGGHFAIVVALNNAQVLEASGDAYSGGQVWLLSGSSWASPGGNYDLDFKTYMNTPTPTPTAPPAPTHTPVLAATPTETPSPTLSPTELATPSQSLPPAQPEASAAAASASFGTGSGSGSAGGTDWTLPALLGVAGLLALAVGAGFMIGRRRQPSS